MPASISQESAHSTTSNNNSNQQHNIEKLIASLQLLAKDNASLLNDLRAVTRDKSTFQLKSQELETNLQQLNAAKLKVEEEARKAKAEALVAKQDLEHYSASNSGNNNNEDAQERVLYLEEEVRNLKDQHDDDVNFLENVRNENETLKEKIKTLESQLQSAASQQQQQQQQQHVDPNNNNNNDNNTKKLQDRIDTLEKELAEIRSQRDVFIQREEKLNSRESRDVHELQQWSQLLRKLCTNFKQVRSQWDADVEKNEEVVAATLASNLTEEQSRYTREMLARISSQLKKSSNNQAAMMMGSSTMNNTLTMNGSMVASSLGSTMTASGGGMEPDNFTTHLKPAVLEILKLVHGCFSDGAYFWALVSKHKQDQVRLLQQQQAAQQQSQKSGVFGGFFGGK